MTARRFAEGVGGGEEGWVVCELEGGSHSASGCTIRAADGSIVQNVTIIIGPLCSPFLSQNEILRIVSRVEKEGRGPVVVRGEESFDGLGERGVSGEEARAGGS